MPASPRGKPRGRNHALLPRNELLNFVRCGRILSAPTGAVETIRLQQPTEYTPSASHSLSSSLREGAKGTSCQRAGQGTNVLVQALCVIVWRHCRPLLQPQNGLQIINSCANYLFSVLKFRYSMDIIACVIFVIGKLNHWQISRLSEKQSYGAAQCGGQLQFLRDALPEGAVRFFCFSVA